MWLCKCDCALNRVIFSWVPGQASILGGCVSADSRNRYSLGIYLILSLFYYGFL